MDAAYVLTRRCALGDDECLRKHGVYARREELAGDCVTEITVVGNTELGPYYVRCREDQRPVVYLSNLGSGPKWTVTEEAKSL